MFIECPLCATKPRQAGMKGEGARGTEEQKALIGLRR
jgi:hypothetical protein